MPELQVRTAIRQSQRLEHCPRSHQASSSHRHLCCHSTELDSQWGSSPRLPLLPGFLSHLGPSTPSAAKPEALATRLPVPRRPEKPAEAPPCTHWPTSPCGKSSSPRHTGTHLPKLKKWECSSLVKQMSAAAGVLEWEQTPSSPPPPHPASGPTPQA